MTVPGRLHGPPLAKPFVLADTALPVDEPDADEPTAGDDAGDADQVRPRALDRLDSSSCLGEGGRPASPDPTP